MSAITKENLPKSMRYGLTGSTAVAASNQMARFSSVNGNSYTAGGANEVRIRIKANGFLDVKHHFLQFSITGAANTGFVDTHAGSFFDRITIEANGSIVEQINSYGLYNAIRKNYNRSMDEVVKDNCCAGGCRWRGCDCSCQSRSSSGACDDMSGGNLCSRRCCECTSDC